MVVTVWADQCVSTIATRCFVINRVSTTNTASVGWPGVYSIHGVLFVLFHRIHFVVSFLNGGTIYPSYFNTQLNKALKATGLPHYSVHQIRHTHITLLMSNGVDLSVISLRAGHARVSTTSDVYAYALPSTDQIAANLLDSLLINSKKETTICSEVSGESIEDYHKAKEQMARLGFEDYDEYLDYLEFVKKKRSRGLSA